jgi:3-hydroxyisobutyrate dehydrogenase
MKTMQRSIGLVGTGLMGAGMARSLIRNGNTPRIYDRTRAKADAVAKHGAGV